MRAHESSRNFLDSRSRVYRIPTDWPGPANFQQPLNYGRIPWSANRISPSHHVHSPGGAPTKTCFDCTFHRRNPAGLGHFPRKPRLRAKAKALIQTGRTEAGALSFFTPFIGDMPRTLPLHRMILSVNAWFRQLPLSIDLAIDSIEGTSRDSAPKSFTMTHTTPGRGR